MIWYAISVWAVTCFIHYLIVRPHLPKQHKAMTPEPTQERTIAAFKERLRQKVEAADCFVFDGVGILTKEEVLKLLDETH